MENFANSGYHGAFYSRLGRDWPCFLFNPLENHGTFFMQSIQGPLERSPGKALCVDLNRCVGEVWKVGKDFKEH